MALQIAMTYKGIAIPAAYVEIVETRKDKTRMANLVFLRFWTDSTKAHSLEGDGIDALISFPYDNAATTATTYDQLKTLPEFADAVDV